MRKSVIFVIFLSLVSLLTGLDVSGNQSGNWGINDSPINVIGDVTIPFGEELSVAAGVEIIAAGNFKITALGTIQINGTEADTVRFHGLGGLDWGGLRLENETEQSVITYCRISNTDDNNDYAVHSINSPVLITYSYFDDHRKAVSFSSISTTNPSIMEIRNSRISDCMQNGILINDNSNAIVDSCEITRCGLGTQYRGAIQLGLQSSAHNCSPLISNNWIHHNSKQGIIMSNLFGYEGMAPTIENNVIENNLTGVYFYSASGTANNNIIRNNFIAGNANSGAGVMLYGSMSDAVFTNNNVYGNFTGFYLLTAATANLGNLENASAEDDGYNWIHDNVDEYGNVYSVFNNSEADVYAQNNFWDSFDETEIAETIIDSNDDDSHGTVNFLPLAVLNPPLAVVVETNTEEALWGMTVTITPPDESTFVELLGYNVYVNGEFTGDIYETEIINLENIEPAIEITIAVGALYNIGESETVETVVENYVFKAPSFVYSLADSTITVDITAPQPGSSTDFSEYQIYIDGDVVLNSTDETIDLTDYCNYGATFDLGISALYAGGYESDVIEETITFVGADDEIIQYEVISCFPNPFNPTTTISFNLQTESQVDLVIYNVMGKRIKTLLSSNLDKGYHESTWNGLDDNRNPVASGIYFYQLKTNKMHYQGKMILMK